MATSAAEPMPEIVTEALVVIDLVESTLTSNLFGWYAVGRHSLRDLRSLIHEVGSIRGLRCMRSTGDGYLLTFYDPQSAEMAAIRAVEAVFELMRRTLMRNQKVSEERALNLRCAVHLGEVDVVPNDREGPHVSMAFRLEDISRASLPAALNPIPPEQFPLQNYVLCSEEVAGILSRRASRWELASIGLLKLKGFPGWREVFLVLPEANGAKLAPTMVNAIK
jgi:class 3 adenylate cyclase